MITYFVHSTSVDNEKHVFSGWSDPPLSSKGVLQAKSLKDQLLGNRFDVVYCSDLARAQSTAAIVFDNYQIIIDKRLREMNYGNCNGAREHKFPLDQSFCILNRFANGENCIDVEKRIRSFLEDVDNESLSIAIVSHKYPQLALEVIRNGMSWEEAISEDWRKAGIWQCGWNY